MDSIVPRYQLPDNWSGKGVCPVCRTPGSLLISHQTILPDRMECGVCGAAFEMQQGGVHIRLLALPPELAGRAFDRLDTWLLPAEVPTIGLLNPGDAPDEPFAQDLLPPAPANSAVRADQFAADLVPPAPLMGTGPLPLRRTTGSLTVRPGSTAPLNPDQISRPEAGALPRNFETAPLTPPPAWPTAVRPTPPPPAAGPTPLPATPPPTASPATAPGAEAHVAEIPPPTGTAPTAPTTTLETLHEELDGVLKTLPARPARSEEALVDELAMLLAGLPAAVAEVAPGESAPTNGTAAATADVVSTQPLGRMSRAEAPAAPDAKAAAAPDSTGAADEAAGAQANGLATAGAADLAPAVLDTARVAEFSETARKLHQLGNTVEVIRVTLERSHATPAEARAALASIARAEAQRQKRFRQMLQWVGGGALIVLLILLAIALVISRPAPAPGTGGAGATTPTAASRQGGASRPAATATPGYNPIIALLNDLMPKDVQLANGPSPSPGPTSPILAVIFPPTATLDPSVRANEAAAVADTGLPDWVSQLVPPGITVINVPTPSVDMYGPPDSRCPVTSEAAAVLFGGRAGSWTYHNDTGGWIMILAAEPATVQVPANMSAGYLVLGSALEMRSTLGPATIHGVNFVAISCF